MQVLKTLVFIYLLVICLIAFGSNDANAELIAYDADGQYLGIALDMGGSSLHLYIPSLESFAFISTRDGSIGSGSLFFDSNDCTGTPYLVHYDAYKVGQIYDGRHVIGEKNIAPINFTSMSSLRSNGQCDIGPFPNTDWIPARIVQLPFNVPIVLPLSFELETTHHGKWKK